MVELARHPTGSKFTCNPPVLTTDEDWLVLVDDLPGYWKGAKAEGWQDCLHEEALAQYAMEEGHGTFWVALRKGDVNLIVTDREAYYLRSVGATLVCKFLNLQNKEERVRMFRAIKFGEPYEGRYT